MFISAVAIAGGCGWDLTNGRLARPFDLSNSYWIVCSKATSMKPKIRLSAIGFQPKRPTTHTVSAKMFLYE
jgi:hypothetical protein